MTSQNKGRRFISRPARPDDYDSIVDIDRTLFGGMDYMQSKYSEFFNTGRHFQYVYLDPERPAGLHQTDQNENLLVGYNQVHVVDGGRTVNLQSGRLLPEYRKGNMLASMEFYKSLYQSLSNFGDPAQLEYVGCSRYWSGEKSADKKVALGVYEVIMQQNFLSLETSPLVLLAHSPVRKTSDYVTRLNRAELRALLLDWKSWRHLTADGWLVAGYDILQSQFVENTDVIAYRNETFVSRDPHTERVTGVSFLEECVTQLDLIYYYANVFVTTPDSTVPLDLNAAIRLTCSHLDAHVTHIRARLQQLPNGRTCFPAVGYMLNCDDRLPLDSLASYCHREHGFYAGRVSHDEEHTLRRIIKYKNYSKRFFGSFSPKL